MSRRERIALLLYVFSVLLIALVFSRNRPDSYDADIMQQVTKGMVDSWDFRTTRDPFNQNTPYSSYGIALSILMAPLYAYAKLVDGDPIAAMNKVNAFLLAALALLLCTICRRFGVGLRRSMVASSLVVFGSILVSYSSTGFSELGTACCIAGCIAALQGVRLGSRTAPVVLGMWAGGAILFRTDSIVLVAAVSLGGLLLVKPALKVVAQFALGSAPAIGLWAGYNQFRFGAPWRAGYAGQSFDAPFVRGLYGLLLSSGRGLFVYVPAIVLLLALWRRSVARFGVVAIIACVMLLARLLFYASWFSWNGGVAYGPRFLVPALPVLIFPAIACVELWASWRPFQRVGASALWLVGGCIGFIGASVDYLEQWYRVVNPPGVPARNIDLVLFHWEHFPVLDQTKMLLRADHLTSPYWHGSLIVSRLVPLLCAAALCIVATARLSRDEAPSLAASPHDAAGSQDGAGTLNL